VRSLGVTPNRGESARRLIGKLGKPEQLRVCYEAGPTGRAAPAAVHLYFYRVREARLTSRAF